MHFFSKFFAMLKSWAKVKHFMHLFLKKNTKKAGYSRLGKVAFPHLFAPTRCSMFSTRSVSSVSTFTVSACTACCSLMYARRS